MSSLGWGYWILLGLIVLVLAGIARTSLGAGFFGNDMIGRPIALLVEFVVLYLLVITAIAWPIARRFSATIQSEFRWLLAFVGLVLGVAFSLLIVFGFACTALLK